jgi:hypothetical protein
MGRCETCRHWTPPPMTGQPGEGAGECGGVPGGPDDSWDGPAHVEPNVAAGYTGATLYTRPDFGCVLHEPRG